MRSGISVPPTGWRLSLCFYMALAIYLRRISGLEQLGIGVPIFNRINFKEKKITGMFVSTLPFLNHLDENWSLEEFTEHLNDEWFDLLRHQKYPFGDIMSLAKKKHPDLDHLFHLVLSYQNSRLFQTKDASAFSLDGGITAATSRSTW